MRPFSDDDDDDYHLSAFCFFVVLLAFVIRAILSKTQHISINTREHKSNATTSDLNTHSHTFHISADDA